MLNKNPEACILAQETLEDKWVCRHLQQEEIIKFLDLVSNLIPVHFHCAHDMILNLHAVKTDNSVKNSAPENTNA